MTVPLLSCDACDKAQLETADNQERFVALLEKAAFFVLLEEAARLADELDLRLAGGERVAAFLRMTANDLREPVRAKSSAASTGGPLPSGSPDVKVAECLYLKKRGKWRGLGELADDYFLFFLK